MNTRTTDRVSRPARAKAVSRPVSRTSPAPAELIWQHFGVLHRLTVWPEVVLERRAGEGWEPADAGAAVLDAGAVGLDAAAWRRYLEFVPAAERAFLQRFRYGRLAALVLVARCPGLLADLESTPALVAFLAAHAELRGASAHPWDEMTALHERAGVFGLMEWLGLPADRGALAVLGNLCDPDVPRCLLEPLRTLLWRPAASMILQRATSLTDRQLAGYCHALAA